MFLRCLYAPVSFVSSCQTTFRVSSGFCSFETCAHTKRNGIDDRAVLRSCHSSWTVVTTNVMLNLMCAKNSAALSLLFRTASCGNRGRLCWGCGETRASLVSAADPWAWLAPGGRALPPVLTHLKGVSYIDFDSFLMSEKKGAHATAVCTDPALYVKWDGRTSSEDVCWTSSDWLPWRVSDLLVWSDFCVRNRHLQILLLNTCLTLRLQWQRLRCCIRESRRWYSYARMDFCCHVGRDARQSTTRASQASSSQWSRSPLTKVADGAGKMC